MELLEKISTYIDNISKKELSRYLLISLGIIVTCFLLLVFNYYRKVRYLKKQMRILNEAREEEVKRILTRAASVQQQRKEVDAILEEDKDFKIGGYFKDVLTKLGLTSKKAVESPSQIDREGKYRESILNVKFTDMDMKQLSELLNEIEKNKRIFTKELEVTTSRKTPQKIDVNLTIATLLLKE